MHISIDLNVWMSMSAAVRNHRAMYTLFVPTRQAVTAASARKVTKGMDTLADVSVHSFKTTTVRILLFILVCIT